jgi:hypothetical protein
MAGPEQTQNSFNQMPKWAEITVEVILEGKLIATEMVLSKNGIEFLGSRASMALPGVGLAIDVGFGAIEVMGAINNGTERDVAVQSSGLAGAVIGGGVVGYVAGALVFGGGLLSAAALSAPIATGIVITGAVVGTSQGLEWVFETIAGGIWDHHQTPNAKHQLSS